MQGALEFKTEIELLSRIHHKNVVSLVGFCYEQGEQMLVYEYISKGTLRDCLSGSYMDCRLAYIMRVLFILSVQVQPHSSICQKFTMIMNCFH